MWVDTRFIQPISICNGLEMHGISACRDDITALVEEEIACESALLGTPSAHLTAERAREEESAGLVALREDIDISSHDVFDTDLHELAHSRACRSHCPYHKVPSDLAIAEETLLEAVVVASAHYVVGKRYVLHLDDRQGEITLAHELEETVDGKNALIDRLGLEELGQMRLIAVEAIGIEFREHAAVKFYCCHIGLDGIDSKMAVDKMLVEFLN